MTRQLFRQHRVGEGRQHFHKCSVAVTHRVVGEAGGAGAHPWTWEWGPSRGGGMEGPCCKGLPAPTFLPPAFLPDSSSKPALTLTARPRPAQPCTRLHSVGRQKWFGYCWM